MKILFIEKPKLLQT